VRLLYILRHAKSSWEDETLEDFDRPLGRRGREAAAAMGTYLGVRNIRPALVLCSSARRTCETLERVQETLAATLPVRFERGLYLAEAAALLRRVRRLDDSLASVMLVGHNPGLHHLCLLLAGDGDESLRRQLSLKFPTGSLAVIESDAERWNEVEPTACRLLAFVRARDLAAKPSTPVGATGAVS